MTVSSTARHVGLPRRGQLPAQRPVHRLERGEPCAAACREEEGGEEADSGGHRHQEAEGE